MIDFYTVCICFHTFSQHCVFIIIWCVYLCAYIVSIYCVHMLCIYWEHMVDLVCIYCVHVVCVYWEHMVDLVCILRGGELASSCQFIFNLKCTSCLTIVPACAFFEGSFVQGSYHQIKHIRDMQTKKWQTSPE